jgi:hypothetical protein
MVVPTHNGHLHEDGHLRETLHWKVFLIMVSVIGALIAIGFIFMVKSHDHELAPQPTTLQPISSLTTRSPSRGSTEQKNTHKG